MTWAMTAGNSSRRDCVVSTRRGAARQFSTTIAAHSAAGSFCSRVRKPRPVAALPRPGSSTGCGDGLRLPNFSAIRAAMDDVISARQAEMTKASGNDAQQCPAVMKIANSSGNRKTCVYASTAATSRILAR
jgi:hypothetical protein